MHRILAPMVIGLTGIAILVALGVWQVQRLDWKQGVLARIESTIAGAPRALPRAPDPETHTYLPVRIEGRFGAEVLRVLVSQKQVGAGYRLISDFETAEGTRLLLDRGFVPVDAPLPAPPSGPVQVIGNLHWPDDRNSATPNNDWDGNIFFARDIAEMSQGLNTAPLLVIARTLSPSESDVTPLPVDTSGIPNDHLQYAITWFSLAGVWLIMTGLWITRRFKEG